MLIVVTDREYSVGDFEWRLGEIAKAEPKRIILREKKLGNEEYFALAKRCAGICKAYGVPLALNRWEENQFQTGHLHLPFADFVRCAAHTAKQMVCGVSIHSQEEATAAERLGAAYLVAGHIYETECKKGLAGRGLGFLEEICAAVSIPVYAIGGIAPDNAAYTIHAGAAGVCVMSGLMNCTEPYCTARKMMDLLRQA